MATLLIYESQKTRIAMIGPTGRPLTEDGAYGAAALFSVLRRRTHLPSGFSGGQPVAKSMEKSFLTPTIETLATALDPLPRPA